MLRWLTAGESHGPALLAILEGLPAGVEVTTDDVAAALARRRLGYGRGARMSFEQDEVELLGGVRHGRTQGGPVAIRIGNTEWPKWERVMSADPVPADELAGLARNAPLTRPRPGHADLAGMQKYGFDDARPGARAGQRPRDGGPGRARRGRAGLPRARRSAPGWSQPRRRHRRGGGARRRLPAARRRGARSTPTRSAASTRRRARRWSPRSTPRSSDGDTLGGVVEVLAYGLPPGLGSHVHWDRRLDSRLAAR